MPRAALETWLYRLFLKLAVPKEREIRNFTLIYAPLNLTAFIRLCQQLHKVGYPAHWLSGVLTNIVSGRINTKARPPRTEPVKIREVKADTAISEQSTAPFVLEIKTLLAMWQPFLPFGILTGLLPQADCIRKYRFSLEKVPDDPVADPPTFVLVLFDVRKLSPQINDLRPFLLSDETSDRSAPASDVRERGIQILSTWMWDRQQRTVSFWLPQEAMDTMKQDGWAVSIWRTDNWTHQTLPQQMSDIEDVGLCWTNVRD